MEPGLCIRVLGKKKTTPAGHPITSSCWPSYEKFIVWLTCAFISNKFWRAPVLGGPIFAEYSLIAIFGAKWSLGEELAGRDSRTEWNSLTIDGQLLGGMVKFAESIVAAGWDQWNIRAFYYSPAAGRMIAAANQWNSLSQHAREKRQTNVVEYGSRYWGEACLLIAFDGLYKWAS